MAASLVRAATTIVLAVLILLALPGCPMYTSAYWQEMTAERSRILSSLDRSRTAEYELDRGIAECFDMLVRTVPPGNRKVQWPGWLNPLSFRPKLWRVGFVEVTSVERKSTKLDSYVAEKTLLLARLTGAFGRYFEISERSKLDDVYRELRLQHAGTFDPSTMQRWGRLHGLSFIILGVTATSNDYIDISLRMDAVETGRVVAVGNSKIARDEALEDWLGQ